jgi:hypothetical protein
MTIEIYFSIGYNSKQEMAEAIYQNQNLLEEIKLCLRKS